MEFLKAFLIGGLLCTAAQILIDRTKLTPARILTASVIAGAFLSAVGIYDKIKAFGGAGATVPLPGFGHLMVQGVKEAVNNEGAMGILTGGLSSSGAGIAGVIVLALFFSLISRPKMK